VVRERRHAAEDDLRPRFASLMRQLASAT